MASRNPYLDYYDHGRFRVAGGVLPNAVTAYKTYGDPANPCIVFPTCYGAKMASGSEYYLAASRQDIDRNVTGQDYLVGEGKVTTSALLVNHGMLTKIRLWTRRNTS